MTMKLITKDSVGLQPSLGHMLNLLPPLLMQMLRSLTRACRLETTDRMYLLGNVHILGSGHFI